MRYTVSIHEHGWSLLAFLKLKGGETCSIKKIKKAIETKNCKVGGRVEFFSSRKLMEGDVVEFDVPSTENNTLSMPILFEDGEFVIVNKPAGLVSSNEEFQRNLGEKSKNWRLIHRLDKDTSGLVLLAKTDVAEESAKKLFSERIIQKTYLAVVDGKVSRKRGVIDNFLGKKGGYQGQTLYGSVRESEGQRAITHWRVIGSNGQSSLVLCDLKTGRTHQIRVHMSEMSHPILGDYQYSKKGFINRFSSKRQLLHAWKLAFIHPKTQKEIAVIAPLPLDFVESLKALNLTKVFDDFLKGPRD